jgi:microcystin-dependent protein
MVDFAGTSAPAGWLMCDGAAISRAVYASLFASVGTSYGAGDGSTTFNLPDFRGRFARYNDNMGTAQGAAGRDIARVHGSTQTQATAKNNLAISDPGHSHAILNRLYIPTGTSTNTGGAGVDVQGGGASFANTNSSGTGVTLGNGDVETRPINLSCNRIIKY